MRWLVVRSLVLACSLTLALPPGWCCIFQAGAAEEQPASHHCCGSPKQAPTNPDDDSSPQAPPHGPDCPCVVRATTPVPKIDSLDVDLTPAALQVSLLDDSPSTSPGAVDAVPSIIPSQPLHVLQCCWLC